MAVSWCAISSPCPRPRLSCALAGPYSASTATTSSACCWCSGIRRRRIDPERVGAGVKVGCGQILPSRPTLVKSCCNLSLTRGGAIAQLGEPIVRTDEFVVSFPTTPPFSTLFFSFTYTFFFFACTNLSRRILTEWNFCLTSPPVFMHLFVYPRHAPK